LAEPRIAYKSRLLSPGNELLRLNVIFITPEFNVVMWQQRPLTTMLALYNSPTVNGIQRLQTTQLLHYSLGS